jgi:hypothetical protein
MSTQADTPQSIPDYDPGLFVNREPEIKMITDMVQALSLGKEVRKRTIIFWGYKGSGRTWLLKHLAKVLAGREKVKILYLNLDRWAGHRPEQAVMEIVTCIAEQLKEWLGSSAEAVEGQYTAHCEKLQSDIQQLLNQYVAALLVDHVYESDKDLLERLEEHVLTLAAVQSRVLVIMAGRGQAYPWKTPELRLYAEDYHLEHFDEDLTQEQLKKQKPEAVSQAAEIYQMSRGYPLSNYLLADRPPDAALQETVDGLLEDVPVEERSWIEALCILRSFDEDHLPPLLAAHSENKSIAEWQYKEIRQARDRLLRTRMVRWCEEAGGWEVDRAIRLLLDKYLQQAKPAVWRRLQYAAYRLYATDWMKQYPDEEDRWQKEADYHAERLKTAGYDPDEYE